MNEEKDSLQSVGTFMNHPARNRIFVLGGLLAVVIVGTLGYRALRNSGDSDIVLEFTKPGTILIGEPFAVTIQMTNNSDRPAQDMLLSLEVPDGVAFVGQSSGQRFLEQAVGELGPGSFKQQTYNLIVVDGEQPLKRINASLVFKTSGSSANFEKKSQADLFLGRSAIDVKLEAPQKVVSGEAFSLKIKYRNNSETTFKNATVEVEHTSPFVFKESSRPPKIQNSVWNVGALAPGDEGELTISGSAVGPDNAFFGFTVAVSSEFGGREYAVNTQTASVAIASSPLSLVLSLNGIADYVATIGENVRYTLAFRNNSDTTFKDITLKATLSGVLFDIASVGSEAFLNSVTNTLTWSRANTPLLASLEPGQEGAVTFSVRLKPTFPVRRLGDKNFTVALKAQIESPTVPAGTAVSRTISVADIENKVAGILSVDAQAFFRDAAAGIVNTGPYPPRVNQPTQYTIHWILRNTAADVSAVKVSAFLQSGARWTGVTKSSTETAPVYDANTGLVTWDIPTILANQGVIDENRLVEAVFQVEATPPVTELGRDLQILSETTARARDDFSGRDLTSVDARLTSQLPDDLTIAVPDRRIQP